MARVDMPLDAMREYRPQVLEPENFDKFWRVTIAESRAAGGDVTIRRVDTPMPVLDSCDVAFPGFGGDPIRAWFTVPAGAQGPLPGVVEYVGYNGGRGLAHQVVSWALAGFAYLRMDNRGQGGGWNAGSTPDPHGSAPAYPGVMTRGIESPKDYYYRRLVTDAVLAVDVLRSLPQVDESCVCAVVGSQGGGLTLAVAGLVDGLTAVMPDFPLPVQFRTGHRVQRWQLL